MGASIAFWAEDIKVLERQSSLWVCKQAAPPTPPGEGLLHGNRLGPKGQPGPGSSVPPPHPHAGLERAGSGRLWTLPRPQLFSDKVAGGRRCGQSNRGCLALPVLGRKPPALPPQEHWGTEWGAPPSWQSCPLWDKDT